MITLINIVGLILETSIEYVICDYGYTDTYLDYSRISCEFRDDIHASLVQFQSCTVKTVHCL